MTTTSVLFQVGEPLVTAEAAKVWGVSRPTVCRWIREGYVHPVRVLPGRAGHLFTAEEVARVKDLFAQGLRFGSRSGRRSAA